jgi:tRNA threonylcarbamoyladenosine biosynthesis protein TsaE
MKPIETRSPGPETTRKIAAAVADLTAPGDVILLDGDLGAGKTTFTQGFARRLGVTEPVTSPTFTLMRRYSTSAGFDLCHADLYRLEQLNEVIELGFNEILDEGAAAIIEWGEKGAPAFGPDHLSVNMSHAAAENDRRIVFTSACEAWGERWDLLAGSLP